jgi:3-oxoacyl-(acyl-carrier-protein) synthase
MGSGAFASDSEKAAAIRDILLINKDGTSTPIGDEMPAQITDFKLYSVSPISGAKFSYGGPGSS